MLTFVVIFLVSCPTPGVGEPAGFRPPAVPLVTVDPYMSVWSFSDNLYDSWPVHWTGKVHALAGMVRVDGRAYRFMGRQAICPNTAKQVSVRVMPTRTFYTFEAGSVELTVCFMTPMLPADMKLLTSPVTFLTFRIKALDGKSHAVTVYFDVSGEWVVNKPEQKIVWRRMPSKIAGMQFISMGSAKQPVLEQAGDNVRIDWGYLYVGAPGDSSGIVAAAHGVRQDFVKTGVIPGEDDTRMPRSADDDWPVIACTLKMDTSGSKSVWQTLILAYDDIFSIEYMGQKLRPWYYQEHGGFISMLKSCVERYPEIWRKCCAFDAKLLGEAKRIGGDAYKHLVSISYRHTWASGKVVISPDGSEPWFFHKECFSNGCMATVDVSYPASPFFALFSPTLLNGMVAPVFEYAASDQWPYEFAPHDVGKYPRGNGQAYSRDRKTGKLRAERQMPVEECGNMILMTAAGAKASGNAVFAERYWNMLSQWADYLRDKGLDPENQLCTDDFTGHLAHNVNLSLKAINALGGYAMLCDMLGKTDRARQFRDAAKQMAEKWQEMADDGDHYRLAFDKPGTWSMKYNLVWDEILGLDLFDPEIARKEVAYYLKIQNAYGLPLDNRADFTKSDWLVWCATLADKRSDFEKLIYPLYRFTNESPDRVPFSDWYFTSTAKVRGFRARPVIGGVFIPFLKDRDRWQKWASMAESFR